MKPELMDMLDASPITVVSGVMFGLPGHGHNMIRKVELETWATPPEFLSHHVGGRIKIGLFDCDFLIRS